jgi:cobyrinic acid a,c-diamide synthase
MKSQFLLAAAHSGAGKTTVTLGLLRALRNKGYRVQPFKCGPDFIDPIHHHTAAGRNSINLDQYMMSDAHIRNLYTCHNADADVGITEGVMGLFDGSVKRTGSSADLAKLLELPVILVLNAKAMAYSAAAILYGLKHFDPAVRIAGVIFNFVDTTGHYRLLQEACTDVGVQALGYLPANAALRIPSRHLGLDTGEASVAIEAAADHLEKHVDLEALLGVTRIEGSGGEVTPGVSGAKDGSAMAGPGAARKGKTVLIARDSAFSFFIPRKYPPAGGVGKCPFLQPARSNRVAGQSRSDLSAGWLSGIVPGATGGQPVIAGTVTDLCVWRWQDPRGMRRHDVPGPCYC